MPVNLSSPFPFTLLPTAAEAVMRERESSTIMLRSVLAACADSGSGGQVVSGQATRPAPQQKSGLHCCSGQPPPPTPRGWRFPEAKAPPCAQLRACGVFVLALVPTLSSRHDKRQQIRGRASRRHRSIPETRSRPSPGEELPCFPVGAPGPVSSEAGLALWGQTLGETRSEGS